MSKNSNSHQFIFDRIIAIILVVMLCVQLAAIEGSGVSNIKVAIMALSPLIIITRTSYVTKAMLWGLVYWLTCYFVALFHGEMRFSTLGYLGLFVSTFIAYYGLLQKGVFSITSFKRFLGILIKVFAIVLVLQQICMLVGIHNMPIINLDNQAFLALDKLPSLCIEPSHTARILAVAMLCYMRCLELMNDRVRPTVKQLFQGENRWVTISFLYCMLTMGSGTSFIALGLLSLYFIRRKTAFYVVPVIVALIGLGSMLELKQFDRAISIVQATTTGDSDDIAEADGSASARVIPLLNTLTMDLFDKDNWLGKGTTSKEVAAKWWNYKKNKIAVVDQYGILGLITSFILLLTCIIRRFLCIEMLLFVILFGLSLINVAYIWGAMFMFAAVRHFQEQSDC